MKRTITISTTKPNAPKFRVILESEDERFWYVSNQYVKHYPIKKALFSIV